MLGELRLPLFEYTDFHQTNSHLYIFGYTAVGQRGKLLRVGRSSIRSLEIECDECEYTIEEYERELKKIQDSSNSNGGLQPVCKAYGILGCFRFLAGYYFLVLTARQFVGSVCGHGFFAVKDVQLIPLLHGHTRASGREQAAEKRYRKLITSGLDLSKDFFVSYSYNLCHTLQTNLTKPLSDPFDSRFVWNEYLTGDFRPKVSTQWVVPLSHGSLEQKVLTVFGTTVQITIIARRSRYFAGTRYRKRGINGLGHVANDVEAEQIVQVGRDGASGRPLLSSMVQMRGSIPLYWYQDFSAISVKPQITLHNLDPLYEATRLHFDDLSERYGDPVVVLNLVKSHEKPTHRQEGLLGDEFRTCVKHLNEAIRPPQHKITYHAMDFTYVFKHKGTDHVYPELKPILDAAQLQSGIFVFNPRGKRHPLSGGAALGPEPPDDGVHLRLQHGLLRTNCIDCLDRTNVAQCIYGLQVLGMQLKELDLSDEDSIDFGSSMAKELMAMYERMGNCLAMQYGGSQAQNKFFQKQRGDWNATVQSRDLVTSITRIYNNKMNDAEKQHAMNLFLGNFAPEPGQPPIWELESDRNLRAGPSHSHFDAHTPRGGNSDDDESDSQASSPRHPQSEAPAEDALPDAPSENLTSGSLVDAAAASEPASPQSPVGAAAGVSESQALAAAVTAKVDGLLAHCSDLDCAAKEVDADAEDEPLNAVGNRRVHWSLARMPMFRGQKDQQPKAPKLHSFDALRSAPQGNPTAVSMQRDTSSRSTQQAPLMTFFRNALNLGTRPRSPRDQSAGIDGRSELSRELSTTQALSRTLSFISNGISGENVSPTAASHTSGFLHSTSGPPEEAATRQLSEACPAPQPLPTPRTRIAGLPLFLHADVTGAPRVASGDAVGPRLNGHLADQGREPYPGQASMQQRRNARSARQLDSPSLDMSRQLSGDSSQMLSAPLLGAPGLGSSHAQHGHGSHAVAHAHTYSVGARNSRPDSNMFGSRFQGGGALSRTSALGRSFTMARRSRRRRPSSPGARSASFTESAPIPDLEHSAPLPDMLEPMRGVPGGAGGAGRGPPGGNTGASVALSEIAEPIDSARQLTSGTASLMPVVDEAFLSGHGAAAWGARGGRGAVPREDAVSRTMQDALHSWVQQDMQLEAQGGAGDAAAAFGLCADTMPQGALSGVPSSTGLVHIASGDVPLDGYKDADTATLMDAWQGAELSVVSETPVLEAEFAAWIDQYTVAFMDPREEARLVEDYAAMCGLQGQAAPSTLPTVLDTGHTGTLEFGHKPRNPVHFCVN